MSNPLSTEKLQSIRAILFDKDGTLIDFDRTWFSISWSLAQRAAPGDEVRARLLLEAGGYDWERSRFRANSAIASGTVHDIVTLWHPTLSGAELEVMIGEYNDYCMVEGARSAVALEGLQETLQSLFEMGYRLGIATNDSEAGAHATAKALGIDHFFDVVIGYDTAARPKPHADPVLYFAQKTGLEPSQIAMVGDNLHDLEAAHAAQAGLAIGVLSGNSPREVLEPHADLILDSIAALPALFNSATRA